MSSFRRGACVLAALALCACNSKKEAAPPATGMPPLDDTAAAAATGHPVHEPVTPGSDNGALPAGHPALPGGTGAMGGGDNPLPAGHPPLPGGGGPGNDPHAAMMGGAGAPSPFQGETPGGAFDPKTVISGVIKLDPKVRDKVQAGDTIFLVARRYEEGSTAPGTPLAVRKLTVGSWPLPFSVDSRDAMLAGTTLSGKVVVTVRVDKDGDAITKNPGDVVGQSKPLEPPSKNVVVQLDKTL
jgi:hypothetical protein